MTDKINGRTPEEIKRGLECCSKLKTNCGLCPYRPQNDGNCMNALVPDSIALIQQLEARNDTLTAKAVLFDETLALAEKYKRERDAAVEAQPKWVSVEERLPEPFVSVIVYMPQEAPCPPVHEGYRTKDGRWYSAHFVRDLDEVTHWMPLPSTEGIK